MGKGEGGGPARISTHRDCAACQQQRPLTQGLGPQIVTTKDLQGSVLHRTPHICNGHLQSSLRETMISAPRDYDEATDVEESVPRTHTTRHISNIRTMQRIRYPWGTVMM